MHQSVSYGSKIELNGTESLLNELKPPLLRDLSSWDYNWWGEGLDVLIHMLCNSCFLLELQEDALHCHVCTKQTTDGTEVTLIMYFTSTHAHNKQPHAQFESHHSGLMCPLLKHDDTSNISQFEKMGNIFYLADLSQKFLLHLKLSKSQCTQIH